MSDITAVSTVAPPTAAAPRPLSENVDLYAEGNTFSEADWAGPEITALFGKDGFTFKDALDIVNPLHHLPVIGTAYRALTGDELAPGPRILGGTLYGGIAGFVSSLANAVMEDGTGKDMGDTVLALFTDGAAPAANVASLPAPSPKAPAAAAATAAPASLSAALPAKAAIAPPPSSLPASRSTDPANLLAAMKGNAGSADENDPTAALIRARAAVPLSRRAASGIPRGTPHEGTPHAAHTGHAAKTLPISFASSKHTGTPTAGPAHAAKAETVAVADSKPPAAPVAGDSPSADIALKMRSALDKYEALMKSRTAPSVSGEI